MPKTTINKNKICIVASKFNEFITKRLLDGCLDELAKRGIAKCNLNIYWVPGSFEIPPVALKLAKKKNVSAVICLGAVIRGETYHFEMVAQCSAKGIAKAAFVTEKPVIYGVLTTETVEQAYKRSQEKGDNKGRDSAIAALEMIELFSKI